jgi:pyrroline-5-carboxylate reductase
MIYDTLQNVYSNHIETNKKAVVSIGAAVTLSLFANYVYKKLTVPPKKYSAFPCITYVDVVKGVFKGETVYEQKKRIVLPILNEANGVYLVKKRQIIILTILTVM